MEGVAAAVEAPAAVGAGADVAVVAVAVGEVGAADADRKMIGVGYRRELSSWLATRPTDVDCLEITAEHFFHGGWRRVEELRRTYKLFVHGLSLSLGTPGRIDSQRLERFAQVVTAAQPEWISEHIAFTRIDGCELGHLTPVPPTREFARIIADHALELGEHCERPVILENITSHLRIDGELSEVDFLNEICTRARCGLLLDVTNLFINSRNHRFDPIAWLDALDVSTIRQLHLVGYAQEDGRYSDDHAHPVQPEILELATAVLERAPSCALILERDAAFPGDAAMTAEIAKLRNLLKPQSPRLS